MVVILKAQIRQIKVHRVTAVVTQLDVITPCGWRLPLELHQTTVVDGDHLFVTGTDRVGDLSVNFIDDFIHRYAGEVSGSGPHPGAFAEL